MDLARVRKRALAAIDQRRDALIALSLAIHRTPELGYQEREASARNARLAEVFQVFPQLRERTGQLAGTMSGGEQAMLSIGRGLMAAPKLLIIDEPSLGLSPRMQGDVFATVQQIAATGVTVLVVEQNVRGALLISDRALVMEQGRKFMEGPAAEVRTDPRIRQAYLGGNIQQSAA